MDADGFYALGKAAVKGHVEAAGALLDGGANVEQGDNDGTTALIDAADCDSVVIGTPIDLRRVVEIAKPATRVRYDLKAHDNDRLVKAIEAGIRR